MNESLLRIGLVELVPYYHSMSGIHVQIYFPEGHIHHACEYMLQQSLVHVGNMSQTQDLPLTCILQLLNLTAIALYTLYLFIHDAHL